MRYTFADCELDTQLYTLRRAGHCLQLRPKVFQVLTYLLENRHRVVSKQELLAQVWPEHFISEATLENCIKDVRRAVGDTGLVQRLIHTLRGYGYRFVAAVAFQAEMPGDDPVDRAETSERTAPSLRLPGHAAAQSPSVPAQSAGERKVVTILCCGLGEILVLSGHDELDTLHSHMRTLHTVVHSEVHAYGGTVQQVASEHLLAVFGAPVAQEDHATRAVLAALGIQRRARGIALSGQALTVRIGLHTGPVAVGGLNPDAGLPLTLIGDVTHLAVQLHARAAPDMPLCSAATARLVRDTVQLEVAEPDAVPGQTLPGKVYGILGHRPQQPPLVWRGERSLSRFVGRVQEMAILRALLAQVETGCGQVVGIVGEPGMGKSRLLYEFRQHLHGLSVTYVEGQCLSYGQATPYLPVLDTLRHLCDLTEADVGETLVVKVHDAVQTAGLPVATVAPYLLLLLGLPADTDRLAQEPPAVRKLRTFEVLRQLSLHRSQQQPLVMAIENLHWMDPTSEEYLTALVEHLVGAPLLLLLTYRPGYRPPWIDKSYATQLTLPPLRPPDSLAVVHAGFQAQALSDVLVQRILAKAMGNPFFLEELTRAMLEHEAAAVSPAVPDTIQAVLAARIDRLPLEEKRLLQTAAVVGNPERVALLQAVTGVSADVLQQRLSALQTAEFLYEKRGTLDHTYTFKHALTQEVAYQSLLHSTRQQYHQAIAQVLEARFPAICETHPELLAHHCTEAGLYAQASGYWQQAGQRASERSANLEAIGHLTTGLDVLKRLPDTAERRQHELTFLTAMGVPLRATKGLGAPEVGQVYARARELCQQVEETPQLFPLLRGLWEFYELQGALQSARETGEQLLTLAQRVQETELLLVAHSVLGDTLIALGEFAGARTHLAQGLALYHPQQHRAHALRYGYDSGVHCLVFGAWALWYLGYPDRALRSIHDALTLAQELAHPFSLAFALAFAAWLHHLRREGQAAQAQAAAAIALATEQGFALWESWGAVLRGSALAEQGQCAEGIAQLRQGIATWRASGAELQLPYYLTLLAQAYGQAGQAAEGLRVLAEARMVVHKTGERQHEAELYRLQGELLLRQGVAETQEAENRLCQAVAVARQQQAKSLELRAAMSLARLWQQLDKRQAAYDLLAPLYGWFTEGFATADLQEAKALLEELRG